MSIRHDGSYVRSERLQEVSRLIAKYFNSEKKCSIEMLKVKIAMQIGLTEKTSDEYIMLVVKAKGWKINDGFIYP